MKYPEGEFILTSGFLCLFLSGDCRDREEAKRIRGRATRCEAIWDWRACGFRGFPREPFFRLKYFSSIKGLLNKRLISLPKSSILTSSERTQI